MNQRPSNCITLAVLHSDDAGIRRTTIEMRPVSFFAAVAGLFVLTSCTTPSHLLFHQTAVIGADISANTTSGQLNISLGYDRQTTALVPKTEVNENEMDGAVSPDDRNEAMAAVSASEVTIKGIGEYEVNEQFATGKAAVNLARNADAVVELSTLRKTEKSQNTAAGNP